MPITVADLKFFQSERMTDNADGGGRMTAVEIVSGASNQIFDDLSDVDRAAGDVSLRKVYAAVTSLDTDKYLDAGVAVFRAPTDAAVSVLAFSTGSFYDQRNALKNRLEQTISRGARWNGWLWGQHLAGQRVIVLWQRPGNELPTAGARLELVAKAGSVEQYSQFVWVVRVTGQLRTQYDGSGTYAIQEVVCEIAEALTANYLGPEPGRVDPGLSGVAALIYAARYNAESVPLFGIRPTVEAAGIGDFSLKVDSLYAPLIPTAISETLLPDVNPGGDSPALIAGRTDAISFATTLQVVKPDAALFLGSGAAPGSISIAVSGATLTDHNGALRLAGTDVGAVDYGAGVIRWNSACPNYGTASKTVHFVPAARPLQVADTAAQEVTSSNRGYLWVLTLSPIPAPLTLRVSYRVNNVWYTLADQGGGSLVGLDSSYGAGTLNFNTGTAAITTGALPDVDSLIIYTWGTPVNYLARGGAAVDAPVIRGQTEHAPVAPGTVTVSWTVGETTVSVTDQPDGQLSGAGGVGFIRYGSGEWWVRPSVVPPTGTVFTIAYQWGARLSQTFNPALDIDGLLHLQLTDNDIVPGSLSFDVPLEWAGLEDALPVTLTQHVQDVYAAGSGTLQPYGGAIDYSTGQLSFNPARQVLTAQRIWEVWRPDSSFGGAPIVRTVPIGWNRGVAVTANFPLTGAPITVYYRTNASATAAEEQATLSALEFDLTRGFAETITAGSVRFELGDSRYVDVGGQIYRDPSPETGAGTLAGTLDRTTGRVRLTAWPAGGANAVTVQALVTELGGQPIEEVVFRTPASPLRVGTLQLRYETESGASKSKTVDDSGLLEDADCTIQVDYLLGVVRARFGVLRADASLSPEEKLEPWYDPLALVDIAGVPHIWQPKRALADSVVYNAIAQTLVPPDSALLGLDAARLPADGRALIFNAGRLALAHHTASLEQANLSPTQEIACGRTRLYRVAIEDSTGKRLPASFYAVNLELGTVTMASDLNLTGYAGPYQIQHTVADLARLVAVDISGRLALNRPLSHVYPAGESRVSGLLFAGTLQARAANLFAQSTWTGVWADSRIGSAPLAQYNDVQYPLAVSNAGAYPDRYLVQFTSSTQFNVIGENLGLIGTGNINEDCTPINALGGVAYFSIDYRGWGSGWATGNCLRFNLVGAAFPVDLVRAVQPSAPSGADDSVELLFIGNVDSPQ